MQIHHEGNRKKGVFYYLENETKIAEMTYTYSGTDKIIINHTGVSEAYNGTGLGKMLVKAGVDFARTNNLKVIPQCPFAKKIIEHTPEYADVL